MVSQTARSRWSYNNSSNNLSQWVDVLAGANCGPEPLNPQPYAVGLFTACITAEDMDCDAVVERSSPGCIPRTSTVVCDWQVGGCAPSSSGRDELDELLEACVPQPSEYGFTATAAAAAAPNAGSGCGGSGFGSQSGSLLIQATALAAACAEARGGSAVTAPAVAVAEAVAATAIKTATLPSGRSFPGVLSALNRSQSGAGGEWVDVSSDCQLLPYTSQLSRRLMPASVRLLHPGGGDGGAANTSGFAGDGGCCPVAATHVPYIYRHHRTDASMLARVKGSPSRASRDITDFTDQPCPKDERDGRQQWLLRGLRRLRSLVRMPGSSAPMKPCTVTTTTSTTAVGMVDRRTDVTAGSCAAAADADATMAAGAGRGRDIDDAGCASDQFCDKYCCHGGSRSGGAGGSGSIDTATVTPAATESVRNQVILMFAARLRVIPSRRKSL
ncbi:hypothetical protein Vretifemale_3769 [Volvox reticuliferus]|nr:hypothetical protein Vretifemale_3769 [Volvox reticuliferus]